MRLRLERPSLWEETLLVLFHHYEWNVRVVARVLEFPYRQVLRWVHSTATLERAFYEHKRSPRPLLPSARRKLIKSMVWQLLSEKGEFYQREGAFFRALATLLRIDTLREDLALLQPGLRGRFMQWAQGRGFAFAEE